MTCIVALQEPGSGKIWMGADRLTTLYPGGTILSSGQPKIVRVNGKILIGCAGSAMVQNIIQCCEIPQITSEDEALSYLVLKFVPWFMGELEKRGRLGKDGDGETKIDGELLIAGVGPGVFYVDIAGSVDQWHLPYSAIGSGAREAMGSLFSSTDYHTPPSPRDKIDLALRAASALRGDVAPPFDILTTPQDDEE